jgi:hypothetical protein
MLIASVVIGLSSAAQNTTTTGWMIYSDTVGRSLELTPDQEERIRDWNARYDREFNDLGEDGVRHRDYIPLQERRANELRGILTPEQYDRWNTMDTNRDHRSTNTTGGTPGPEMRRGVPGNTQHVPSPQGSGTTTGAGRDQGGGTAGGTNTGTSRDRAATGPGGTGTTGTGSATDGGNTNSVTPPTP